MCFRAFCRGSSNCGQCFYPPIAETELYFKFRAVSSYDLEKTMTQYYYTNVKRYVIGSERQWRLFTYFVGGVRIQIILVRVI